MSGVIFGIVCFFLVFYFLNYIGQKLISRKSSVNLKIIISISFVEALISLTFLYYRPPFL
ncbi:hypothetical protein DI291_10765 [Bacillus paralicheniformis]|nr:hypothetical protein DI291_10765 [Bacillus paralicheniformis]